MLEKQCLAGDEPGADEEQYRFRCVSEDAHKLLFYKELRWISLLQPTGTESAPDDENIGPLHLQPAIRNPGRQERNGLINK